MAVNQTIYKDAFEYSYAGKPLFTTTDTLPTLMESSWQKNTIMENSNVYTTFNAKTYPLLCGATTSSFDLDYELEDGQSATDGVKHITIKRDTPYNVNLRYVYKEQTVGNNGSSMGFRWTGYEEKDYEILKKLLTNTNALSYPDLNVTRRWSSPYDANDNAIYLNGGNYSLDSPNQTFITAINRENLFFQVSLTFGYINENNKIVRLSNVKYSDYKDWLKSDTTGFISLQGHDNCFCLEIAKLLCVNNQNDIENGNHAFVVTSYITKKNLVTGETSVIDSGGAGSNIGNSINILCEKYNQSSCYYYTAPMTSNSDTGLKVPYKRAYFLKSNFTMRAANGSTSDFTYQSVDAFSYSHTELPTFNKGFMTLPFEDIDVNPDEDEFYVNNPTYSEGNKYMIKGRNIMCATITDSNQACNEVYFYKFCVSGKEIVANLSLLLIPFAFMDNASSQNRIDKNTSFDAMFVGVRDEDGNVSGNFIPYVWGETEVEKEFRPDNFTPIDPIPPEPVEPDTDKDGNDSGTVSPAGKVTIGATNGFVTYYALSSSQIRAIGKSLWGNNNPTEILKNFFYFDFSETTNYELSYASILDYFVSLKYYPFHIPSYADTQATGEQGIRIGTGATLIDAGAVLTTTVITNPLAVIDGGTCTVPPYYSSFMDNEPIAVASLYVPFCGTTEVLLSAVTNKPLTLTYYVDMVTGCCVAVVQASSSDGVYPVAELTGVMGFDMMLTGNNHTQQLSSIVSSIRHTALSSVGSIASAVGGAVSKNPSQILAGIGSTASNIVSTAIDMPQTAALHPMTSGTSSSLASLASYHTAFIQIKRKNSITPVNYGSTVGYISNQTYTIGSLSGFTQCVNPNLTGIAATSDEIAMIRDILTSGFYA